MIIQWQWRRRLASFCFSCFDSLFSILRMDQSGFLFIGVSKNVFLILLSFGNFLKMICQEWMAVSFPWTRSTLMHSFVKFKMICRTSDPPKHAFKNGWYDDELHIIWFSSNPKVNVFRSSGNVTVVRSKIHKMKGKHNIFKCSWDRNFKQGNDY